MRLARRGQYGHIQAYIRDVDPHYEGTLVENLHLFERKD